MEFDTEAFRAYLYGFNSVYVDTPEEHLEVFNIIKELGLPTGYYPTEHFSKYHYISFGSSDATHIHTSNGHSMYPQNETVKYTDLSLRFPSANCNFACASQSEILSLLRME